MAWWQVGENLGWLFGEADPASYADELSEEDVRKQQRQRLAQLELKGKYLVSEQFAGSYHAIFKGQGMEFDEVRPYAPGDEVRSIDWNVLARTGDVYVKRYIEERELTVMLLVDVSGSQDIGSTRSKRDLSAEIAALLAFVTQRNHDKVGLIAFGREVVCQLPPRKGRKQVQRIIHALLNPAQAASQPTRSSHPNTNSNTNQPTGTNLTAAFEVLTTQVKQRSVVFVVSDFLLASDVLESALKRLSQRHDVIALQVCDPLDSHLAPVGLLALEDAETGEQLWVDSHAIEQHDNSDTVRHVCRNLSIDHSHIDTDADPFVQLRALFERRNRRSHRYVRRANSARAS
jgi:uncharacterized protein (DUF58 family)